MPMLIHQINIGKNNDEQLELLRMSNSKKTDSIIIKEPCTNIFSNLAKSTNLIYKMQSTNNGQRGQQRFEIP